MQRCDDQALAAADAVDLALAQGQDPGPMAGVPVTIKVNVDQAGFATTNGLRPVSYTHLDVYKRQARM